MPFRADCPGGDHRPPSTGGSCDCGMVTRVPSRPDLPAPLPLVAPDVRDLLARCLYDGPGDPLAADAADHRPDDLRMSGILRRRADRMIAAMAAAGLVVTADTGLSRVA
ncbi:hypothetical protein [Blastococcus tunisiensis]|uniref:Uncharacterized protein n=1 Tax=Blastococcus tunisiensis TaxID=1798228 RepID=A0A1I2KUP0_9ACTN|nr:hypothetical protein [Blastococcus sp. DSM 46838]SFF70263.1 hypothetical protein SAMN05216574_12352 [Blastococcus sp. DSM 46838]